MNEEGLDVSVYQGEVDWPRVEATFIYHRLYAWRPNEQYEDPNLARNVQGSMNARKIIGGYLRANVPLWTPREALNTLVETADDYGLLGAGKLFPAIDIEPTGLAGDITPSGYVKWSQEFFYEWAMLNLPLMVYSSGSYFTSHIGPLPDYAVAWVGHTKKYSSNPSQADEQWAGKTTYTLGGKTKIHQYTVTGRVAGISTDVDRDRIMPGMSLESIQLKGVTAVARQMDLSPNRSSRNGATVRLAAVHTAEGSENKENLGAFFRNPAVEASSHDGGDAFGLLGYVPYEEKAWTLLNGNPISDNLELCAFANMTRDQWMSEEDITYYHSELKRNVTVHHPKALLKWCAAWIRERCLARNIPIKKIDAAAIMRGESGVIGHIDWTNTGDGSHTDPGPNFPWDYVISLANNNSGEDDMGLTPEQDARLTTMYNFLGLTAGAPVNPDTGKRATLFEVMWGSDEVIVSKLGPLLKDVLDAVKAVPGGVDVSAKLDELLELVSVMAEKIVKDGVPTTPGPDGAPVAKLSDVEEALKNVFRLARTGFPPPTSGN